MRNIGIFKDEAIDKYSIEIDGEIIYECLSEDEVTEIIRELMEGETK